MSMVQGPWGSPAESTLHPGSHRWAAAPATLFRNHSGEALTLSTSARGEAPAQWPVLKDDLLSRLLSFRESRSQHDLSGREGLYGHKEKRRLSELS